MSKAADLANLIGNINAGGGGVNRNVIINGAMNVAQRGTSSTGISSGGYYTVDRFKVSTNSAGRSTMTQETITDLPGFANAIKLDCTTADTSLGSGEYLQLSQYIEGQNLQTFAKGTSDAKPMTVSFYVKGNGNATYMCELYDGDNSRRSGIQNLWLAAGSGYSGGTYTANTWAGNVNANRAVGADNFYSSTDNEFFITGFQMEVGQNATTFEHEPFERTLNKCYRYFLSVARVRGSARGSATGGQQLASSFGVPVQMRAAPTVSHVDVERSGCSHEGYTNVNANHIGVMVDVSSTSYWYYNDGFTAESEL